MANDFTMVGIRLLGSDVSVPEYATSGSAGMDVRSREDYILAPNEIKLFKLGFALEIPEGFEVQLRPRSSLALKHGITLTNSPATIDSDYRGEVGVILQNTGKQPCFIEKNERIAQMVLATVSKASFRVVNELTETERGEGGFGSTGQK